MNRYLNLHNALRDLKAKHKTHLAYVEIGTYDGVRASQLLSDWLRNGPDYTASYLGFDLFEDLTEEMRKSELSKSKLPPSLRDVQKRIEVTVPRKLTAMRLVKGNTRETIAKTVRELDVPGAHADLIFLDGGHSLDTIESDWNSIEPLIAQETLVLLDDYYENVNNFGCKKLVQALDQNEKYLVRRLDPLDVIAVTDLQIRMVEVRRK